MSDVHELDRLRVAIGKYIRDKHRLIALFLLSIIVVGALIPTASAHAQATASQQSEEPPKALPVEQPETPVLKDTESAPAMPLGGASEGFGALGPKAEDKQPGEIVEKRTATSMTIREKDGSFTQREYVTPQFFKTGSDWKDIDTALIEDKNAGDSGNILGKAYGQIRSVFTDETTLTVKANDWKARFAPSNDKRGMVRVQRGEGQTGFKPRGANTVNPTSVKDKEGNESVWYYDLWRGVDVQYEVTSTSVKENIIIKNKQSTSSFEFDIIGGSLRAVKDKTTGMTSYEINDAAGKQFEIAPFVISLNKYGFEANQPIQQSFKDGVLKVAIEKTYLQKLPSDAFPVTLDPTVTDSRFGNRSSGNNLSFKSDGYICQSNVCNPLSGTVLDAAGYWRTWRGAIHSPYNFLQGKKLTYAHLHLTQRLGLSTSGSTVHRYFTAAHAPCINSINCVGEGAQGGWALINNVGDIDVTNIYQSGMNAGDWGRWLMILGEEGVGYTTYKNWDPDGTWVSFRYTNITPTPSITTPVSNQVFVDPQVSFQSTTPTNPNSTTPLRYEFCVSTGGSCSGTVIRSQEVQSPTWTVPDGVLQDGSSYVVQVRALDPDGEGGWSGWSGAVPFKIDTRKGKNKTQTYEDVGPLSVDYATGNVSTSESSHSSSALGGSMGISLDYNSPVRSRNGLVAEYWNTSANYPFGTAPTGAPIMSRIDRNVDFNWAAGAPGSGVASDWFYARWSGYFVAPVAGAYQFGGSNDDAFRIKINDQSVYDQSCYNTRCFGTAVSLTAGQVVPISIDYQDATSLAYAHLFVKGAVVEQKVPTDWLQTGARQVAQGNGLTGTYYVRNSTNDLNTPDKVAFLSRTDTTISFDWGTTSPVQGGPVDFMSRWTGYVTVPTSGTYTFGTNGDDGTRIKIGNTQVLNNWASCCSMAYGSGISLSANTPYEITVDHFDGGGAGRMALWVKGAVTEQVVPSGWMSPKAQVLPDGWGLGIDPDGSVSYDRLYPAQNNVILADSTGDTHEYVWQSGGYKPPLNEDGQLSRTSDGKYRLVDADGSTYVFRVDGVLESLTSPVDDRSPAALKYIYEGSPAKIRKIEDGVNSARYAQVYYSGEPECGSAPTNFDAAPPLGMLCALITDDGRATHFHYKDGFLARIARPGSEVTDYQYDTSGRIIAVRDEVANDAVAADTRVNDESVLTQVSYDTLGRVAAITAPAANANDVRQHYSFEMLPAARDSRGAVALHVSGASEPYGFTQRVEYDNLYRTIRDTDKANITTTQVWHYAKDMLLSSTDATGIRTTMRYDMDDRLAQQFGPAPAEWFNEWKWRLNAGEQLVRGETLTSYDKRFVFSYGTDGNLVLSGSAGTIWSAGTGGKASDRLVMQTDGNLVLYNGSAVVWSIGAQAGLTAYLMITDSGNATIFSDYGSRIAWSTTAGPGTSLAGGNYGVPFMRNMSDVPRTDTGYDEGMQGVQVAWYNAKDDNFIGAPRLHTNGINPAEPSRLWINTTNPASPTVPIQPDNGATSVGFKATGKFSVSTEGIYTVKLVHANATRLWIDDKLLIDGWDYRSNTTVERTATMSLKAGVPLRFALDYANIGGGATIIRAELSGPNTATVDGKWNGYLRPAYNLLTSTTVHDARVGNTRTVNDYGTTPQLGLIRSVTEDAGGLNLVTTNTYETVGSGYLRQTAKTLPGGSTTQYLHYGGQETRDNPCTTAVTEAFRQAGMQKGKIEQDPDGAGSQTSRTSETVYDDAGRVVASRYNADPWTCTTYDDRGRTLTTTVPDIGNAVGRAITNNHAVNGNPLVTSTSDESGTLTTTNDLLGRIVSYKDAKENTTTTTYDQFGKVVSRSGPLGAEVFEYDQYDRLMKQKLDGIAFATVAYDQYSRIASVQYPNGQTLGNITRDTQQRETGVTYTLANGQAISDAVTYSVSGKILSGVEAGKAKSYTYDRSGRLTAATIGGNAFTYGFGASNSVCNSVTGNNTQAGRSGNRTVQTINGATTTYCYDQADRLVASSSAAANAATYDAHGNTIGLGSGTNATTLTYDASDRNIGIVQGDISTTYIRDVQDRIISRAHAGGTVSALDSYGFTGSGDTPEFITDEQGNVTEKYLTLPGDVFVTIRPDRTSAGSQTFSLPNIHGDVFVTTDADGALTGTFTTGPFGEQLDATTPWNTTSGATHDYVGQYQKTTETNFTLPYTQMGARVYVANLGRFLQVDPVEGGVDNNYVYPTNPVNENDVSGMCPICIPIAILAIRALTPIVTKQLARRAVPRDVAQQIALKAANRSSGKVIIKAKNIKDSRFKGNWDKRAFNLKGKSGRNIDVHWMQNKKNGARTQIKIYDNKYNKSTKNKRK